MSKIPPQQELIVHKWSDEFEVSQVSANSYGTYDFRLSNISQAGTFDDLFQQYQIRRVEIFWRPMFRANPANPTTYQMPLLYLAVDVNDSSSWATMVAAQSADNVMIVGDDSPFMLSFRPQPVFVAYDGAVSNAYAQLQNANAWLDTGNSGARHYGLKFAITGGGLASQFQTWVVNWRLTVAYRFGK